MKRKISLLLIVTMILGTMNFASSQYEKVEVEKNYINVTLNGVRVEADNLLYEDSTYVKLRTISEMINADITWDGASNTADLILKKAVPTSPSEEIENETVLEEVDPADTKRIVVNQVDNILITYDQIGLKRNEIKGISFRKNDVSYKMTSEGVVWMGQVKVGSIIKFLAVTYDNEVRNYELLATLENVDQKDQTEVVYIPAMPEKGFNHPFMIRIPGKKEEIFEKTDKKYLMFDMINNGSKKSLLQCKADVKDTLEKITQSSIFHARNFGYPIMMPIIPRSSHRMEMDKFGTSYNYEHALDRGSVYVKELTTTDSKAKENAKEYTQNSQDPKDYYDMDEQVKAMMVFAIDYLKESGIGVEDQVILDGYSASGTFTDRFANLHPDIVKMVVSGATVDDLMLPMKTFQKRALPFPVGISDYKTIVGREFDLHDHNQVARLLFMGKDDDNNTVGFSDCYFEETNDLIIQLFGKPVLPRAIKNIELYGQAGGKGIFILDKGIKHGSSSEMDAYIVEFIKANVASDKPVYPKPKVSNLEYTIYE